MQTWKIACFLGVGITLTAPAFSHTASGLHWETLHVYHTEPTEVFSKLGLTHSTRYGHTLGQKHVPDPTFPPGLTDVVPYDAGHALLVRGTTQGLAQFRERVAVADVPDPRWQLSVTLLQNDSDGGNAQIVGGQTKTVSTDQPIIVAFDTGGQMPEYELTLHLNPDETFRLSHRISLSLGSAAGSSAGVFVPASVWTPMIWQDVRLGDTLTFADLATDRAAARQQLGQAMTNQDGDYTVQIQITALDGAKAPALAAP